MSARRESIRSSKPLGMAKTSKIQKDIERKRFVEHHAAKRAALLAIMKDYEASRGSFISPPDL